MARHTAKLIADIHALMAAVQADFMDLGTLRTAPSELAEIEDHVDWCINELRDLLEHAKGMSA